jgi:AraC-like DNA-binding protein
MRDRIPKRHDQSTRLNKLRGRAGFDRAALRQRRGAAQSAISVQSQKTEKRSVFPLPDFEQRLYPAQKLAVVVDVLADEGVPASEALKGSELTPADFLSASTRVSYRQMIAVYDNAIRLSKDPAIAFRVGRRMHLTSYGMYGYALLSCPNHAAAAEFAAKYTMTVGPTFALKYSSDAEQARYQFLEVVAQDPTSDLYRFALEFTLSMLVTVSNDLFDLPLKFSSLRVACPPPAHASVYNDLFRCPIFFNAEVNEIELAAAEMEKPIACANPITLDLARRACEDILKEAAKSDGFASQVRRALVRTPNRFPRAESIAMELGLSPRQLHRNLQIEKTSYRKLLDEVRMGLAIKYLRKTRITTDDIARLSARREFRLLKFSKEVRLDPPISCRRLCESPIDRRSRCTTTPFAYRKTQRSPSDSGSACISPPMECMDTLCCAARTAPHLANLPRNTLCLWDLPSV